MNRLAVLLIFLAAIGLSCHQEYTKEQKMKFHILKEDCIEEAKAIPELVDKYINGEMIVDEKVTDFAKCVLIQTGTMTDLGVLQVNTLKELIPGTKNIDALFEVIDKCKGKKGATPGETAYLVYSCLQQNGSGILRME